MCCNIERIDVADMLSKISSLFRRPPKVCVTSLAIGDRYLAEYNLSNRNNHENYCKNSGYDFRVVTDYIDSKIRDPSVSSLQKALVCEAPWAKNYDILIYIDADTVFTAVAGQMHELGLGHEKIVIADEYSQPTSSGRIETQRKMGWEDSATKYYDLHGFNINITMVFNTGVMIFQPKRHAKQMRAIFDAGVEQAVGHPRGFHYEQALIGYHLQSSGNYRVLPNQWNAVWAMQKYYPNNDIELNQFATQNYLVHFAGGVDGDQAASIDPCRTATT